MKPFLSSLLDFLFPPICHVCRSFIPQAGPIHICHSCSTEMQPITRPLCLVCGIPFAGAGDDHTCGACLKEHPPFDAARAAFVYGGHCRDLVHRLKYGHQIHLRRPLALLTCRSLTDFICAIQPDMIVPVPLHPGRLARRGFNQAILLGELMGREWNLPLMRQALRRSRDTPPQIGLSADQRRENVRAAFTVDTRIGMANRRVLLVDDVVTTGSTIAECSKTLKKSGAAAVFAVTVARAVSL